MIVEALFAEHAEVLTFLQESREISFANTLGSTVPKIVLLAAASFLEVEVCRHIQEFYAEVSGADIEAISFVRNKAISRQYHTYFNWKDGTANTFLGLFGEDAAANFKHRLKQESKLADSVKDFCTLGSLRNQLVHGNYAAFSLEKTADEVFALYRSAEYFVAAIPGLIRHRTALSGG